MRKRTGFFKVPHDLVDSGEFATFSGTDAKVFIVLKNFENYRTGECFPSIEKIARLAGVSKASVYASIEKFENSGYLSKNKGIGRGNPNRYHMQKRSKN